MSAPKYRRNRRPLTRWDYHSLQVIYLCLVLIGPALIFYAKYAEHRDRPSLQWPKVSGKVMLCEEVYHAGSLHGAGPYHSVAVSYTYVVNGATWAGGLRFGARICTEAGRGSLSRRIRRTWRWMFITSRSIRITRC